MFWIIVVPLVTIVVFACFTFLEHKSYDRNNEFDSVFDDENPPVLPNDE